MLAVFTPAQLNGLAGLSCHDRTATVLADKIVGQGLRLVLNAASDGSVAHVPPNRVLLS